MMKKVIVTGATGFIGRCCLPLLQKRGYEIYAISSKKTPDSQGIQWIQCDLLNSPSIQEMISSVRPTHLLHLAWNAIPGRFWTSLDNLAWLKSSLDLVHAFASQGGKRIVCAGTCAEYDWAEEEFIENNTLCSPHSLYGSSKLALHLLIASLAKLMGFSQAWGRIFYLYGPHEYPQRFVPSIIQGILKERTIPCSHGNQVRDFLYVEDAADAFATLLDSEIEGAINIGSGQGILLKQVIEKICDRLGGQQWIQLDALPPLQNDPAQLVASTRKLNEELGWTPRYSLEEGLERVILWWKKEMGST